MTPKNENLSNAIPSRFFCRTLTVLVLLCSVTARAQLAVTVSPVKIEGNKAIVKLSFRNNLTNEVASARASLFILDNEKKTVGQATRWVIGGSKGKAALPSNGTNVFYFVVTAPKPFTTTNLTSQVTFGRVQLGNGKVVDVKQNVEIHE